MSDDAPEMTEAERKLLADPERLARIDAALVNPDTTVPWAVTPRPPR